LIGTTHRRDLFESRRLQYSHRRPGNPTENGPLLMSPETDENAYPVIGEGASAIVSRLPGNRVLKLFRPNLAPILLERELCFAQVAHDHGIPTPKPLGRQSHRGCDGLVFEYFEGQNLDVYTLPRIWAHRRLTEQIADIHAAIHRVDLAEADQQRHEDRSQKALYRQLIGYSELLSDDARALSLTALESAPDGTSLCHGDMSPLNVMTDGTTYVTIDWSLASIGDPVGDFAFTWIAVHDLAQMLPLNRTIKWALRRASRWYLARYRAVCSGRPSEAELEAWLLPAAAARLGAVEKAGGGDEAAQALRDLVERYARARLPAV
jgi:aminoglycoside phosphotransferase (APT) family kinase protein